MPSDFDTLVPKQAELFKRFFGLLGTYEQSGTEYEITFFVDSELQTYPDVLTAQISASNFEIEFYNEDLPVSPLRGDVITLDGDVYDVISTIFNDGFWTRLAVVKR